MYFFILILCFILLVDSYIIDYKANHFRVTHFNKSVSNEINCKNKCRKLYSKGEKGEEGKELGEESEKNEVSNQESQEAKEDEEEMVEFIKSSPEGEELSSPKLRISKNLWKVLTGLLVYRSKFGDYRIENDFEFKKDEKGHLSGYKLGRNLGYLLNLLNFQKRSKRFFNNYRERLKRRKCDFLDSDLKEAPKLLWLLGFPTKSYFEESKLYKKYASRDSRISSKMARWPVIRGLKKPKEEGEEEKSPETISNIQKVKKIILENMLEHKKIMKDKMTFSNPQQLPEPSNKTSPTPDLLKKIVKEILNKNRATCPLIKRDTRYEKEGGYHYAFYHWSFEQVLQALVMFNEMYFDYNKELLIESERSGGEFKPITFNSLKPSWRIPENEYWPKEFQGMPLGVFVDKFRVGDIDAKEHWLRRPVLDRIGFNWGDGLKYLAFTWDKLEMGLLWYINFRGFPISDLPPDLVIPKTSLVAKFGKPEELQGLKLGKLLFKALDQMQVLRKYYKMRFDFLHDMGLDFYIVPESGLGYRPIPHSKYNWVDTDLLASSDEKYLFDKINEPPEDFKGDLIKLADTPSEYF